jgi:hypothetical protein
MNDQDMGDDFSAVFDKELEDIKKRREAAQFPLTDRDRPETLKRGLVGLALSGGGIRSATFCLGLLQELKRQNLLRIFDYLSTVSGGGYVGGWWSAWLSRPERTLEDKLFPSKDFNALKRADERRKRLFNEPEKRPSTQSAAVATAEAGESEGAGKSKPEGAESAGVDPVHHLRLYANYLTPRKGALSQDTWRAVAIITRNLLMTWLVLLPIIVGLVVAGQLYFVMHRHPARSFIFYPIKEQDSKVLNKFAKDRWENEVIEDKMGGQVLEQGLARGKTKAPAQENPWDEAKMARLRKQWERAHKSYDSITATWDEAGDELQEAKPFWLDNFKDLDSQKAYHREMLFRRLRIAAEPLVAIVGWIALMIFNWLLLTLQLERARSRLVITASLIAVAAVVLCILFSYPRQLETVVGWLLNPKARLWRVVWLLVAVVLGFAAWKPVRKAQPPAADENSKPSWLTRLKCWLKAWQPWSGNEGWRNRINILHTRLLMLLVIMAVVLAIAGFGHEIIQYPYLDSPGEPKDSLLFKIGVGVILVALAGMIFTAYKASPMGGGDKRQMSIPSMMSRVVFMILPWLVVLLIAFAAAWVGHNVVVYMWELHLRNKPIPFIQYAPYIALFGVAISFILALFEMNWQPNRRVVWLALALPLPALTALVVLGKLSYRLFDRQVDLWLSILALIICGFGLFFIALDIKDKLRATRVEKKPSDAKDEETNTSDENRPSDAKKEEANPFYNPGLGGIIVRGMIGLIYAICFFHEVSTIRSQATSQAASQIIEAATGQLSGWSLFYADTLLLAATLAGGCILYRLIMVADQDEKNADEKNLNARQFRLIFSRASANNNKQQARRFAVAACCFLAVAGSCVIQAHNVALQKEVTAHAQKSRDRAVAEQDQPSRNLSLASQPSPTPASPATSQDTPPPESQSQSPTQKSCFEKAIEFINVFEKPPQWMGSEEYKQYWALPAATFFAACVILIYLRIKDTSRSPKQLIVAFIPVAFVLIPALWMAWEVLKDVGKQPIGLSFAPGLLNSFTFTGIALCLALTRFEMNCGKGDNRRSIRLLFVAYLTLMGLLIHSQIPQGHEHYRYEYAFGVFGLLVSVLTWLVGFGWLANPNTFSMHNFYKWRLVRAYLGASNMERHTVNKDITEAAPGDDMLLTKMDNCKRGAPYHLINATLNLVAGRDLVLAQRSADSFLFSKHYCGSLRTDYRLTKDYMKGQLSLGTAIAVSGAAASPNMGSRTPTSALAMLMTLLNVRLGYWVPTPNKEDWQLARPRLWPFYLIREFFSQTNDLSSYCYLTDGGHFDNTGIYPLVKRGCSFIVAADCGADPLHSFSDLGDVIRLCRIDFGAEIKLDIENFLSYEGGKIKRLMESHFIVGSISYPDEHLRILNSCRCPQQACICEFTDTQRLGTIIIFKPSLTSKDKADLRQYALENPAFPHTATTNQWFDESQFESYRRLGQLCAQSLFEKDEMPADKNSKPEPEITADWIADLFRQIEKDSQQEVAQK